MNKPVYQFLYVGGSPLGYASSLHIKDEPDDDAVIARAKRLLEANEGFSEILIVELDASYNATKAVCRLVANVHRGPAPIHVERFEDAD